MWDFFREGGWGMWAILILGLGLLAAAGRFAVKPERRHLGFLGAMALSTALATLYALSTALGAVFAAVSDADRFPDELRGRMLLQGLKESSRPVSFGLLILTLAALFVTAGMARAAASARDERDEKPAA